MHYINVRKLLGRQPEPKLSFVIAGAQKCGTSALYLYLRSHPQLYLSEKKALRFFLGRKQNWLWPRYDALHAHFRDARPGQVLGEATPKYIYSGTAMKRIADYNPSMKIIMLVRDPVERAYSQWKMYTSVGMEDRPFSEAIRKENKHGYVGRGMYAAQLRRATSLLGRDSILVLTNDELRNDHTSALKRVTGFLAVEPFLKAPEHSIKVPKEPRLATSPMTEDDIAFLTSTYAADMKEFAAMTGIAFPRFQALA
ncbi:MAG: sulfotransferase [Aquamicrobium sp.]|uniref:sulfotransferase n=1 Tax=Aquamicrobium sp. TaxID=1872579 RepID=UPI00349EBF8C|nr:sulfotransferase [Aquamicrobium sp.]